MTTTTVNNWHDVSQSHLLTSLASVRECLEKARTGQPNNSFSPSLPLSLSSSLPPSLSPSSALQKLCRIFQLSDFERDVLLLCAGMELYPDWGGLCADAQRDPKLNYPTFNLALAVLGNSYWSALTSLAPLRQWRLIEIGDGDVLTTAPLRINERILHFLMGASHLDEEILSIVQPVTHSGAFEGMLVDSHQELAQQIAVTWQQAPTAVLPIIQLCGDEIASKRAVAAAACSLTRLNLYTLSAHALPNNTNDFYQLLRSWELEASLSQSALLLDCDDINTNDISLENTIKSFIERVSSPLILTTRDKLSAKQQTVISFDVDKPTQNEQRNLWQEALGDFHVELDGFVDTLVSQFNLTAPEIHAACAKALGGQGDKETRRRQGEQGGQETNFSSPSPSSPSSPLSPSSPPSPPLPHLLWDACRAQARPKLDDLAQRIIPSATWDDIVLPEAQLHTLRAVAAHVRQRTKVYQNWGFAGKGGRGLGISALFSGVSGTGKTMSAEVLAQELELDLYRIDLSSVVSKYIGETEKNLRRVFDAAEAGATILLFDEADALFGKRSDVKDSHDRYANMEVSYLLQRMEEYQGLAILTTNLKDSIDTAFLRRIRFILKYPFPDVSQREEIWRRIFPKNTPLEGLDFAKLAKLNVSGGNIRNIALNAAFIAADAGEAVGMKHIKAAAHSEYAKLERTLTDAEVRGWV